MTVAGLQARRAARGSADPLAVLRAYGDAHAAEAIAAVEVCRGCKAWEWDGTGELPFNPLAGPCAHCGGSHAELYMGCCGECFALGYREACSRMPCHS